MYPRYAPDMIARAILALLLVACGDERAHERSAPVEETEAPVVENETPVTDIEEEPDPLAVLRDMENGPTLTNAELEGVELDLSIDSPVTMREIGSTRVELQLVNRRSDPIMSPRLGSWLVNGAYAATLFSGFVNGPREGDWGTFAPEARLAIRREGVLEDVITRPGAYVISYGSGNLRADALVIAMADNLGERRPVFWIEAEPHELTMAERSEFMLSLFVHNTGFEAVDPEASGGRWTVNGEPSIVIDLAFSNGVQPAGWSELRPDRRAHDDRQLGESLFEAPGEYEIRYQREDGTDAGVRVVVRE